MANATATVWKGGRAPVSAVSGASSAHIRIAEMPISVARPAAGLAVAPTVEELLFVDF
jgi:hypothetical protein